MASRSALPPAAVRALVPCHATPPDARLLAEVAACVGGVLIVDDGLPPADSARLADVAEGAGADLLSLGAHRGKGSAIAHGIDRLLGSAQPPEAVLTLDADGQHPPDAIGAFLAAGASAELVIGNRFRALADIPLDRRLANLAASAALTAVTGRRIADSQCGMRLLRGRALREVPYPEGGFESEVLHLKRCLRAGVRVIAVPIPAIYDGEPSAYRALVDSARIALALAR